MGSICRRFIFTERIYAPIRENLSHELSSVFTSGYKLGSRIVMNQEGPGMV